MLLSQLSRRIALERGLNLEVSEALIAKICNDGYDRSMGARPLRRAIMSLLEDPISEAILLSSSSPSSHSSAREGSKSGGVDGGDEEESTAGDKDANSEAELSGGTAVLSSIPIEEGEGGDSAAATPMSLATSRSGKDSGEYRDGDTIFADLAEDGSTVVTRMPRPDVCDHGLCLPVLKLPAHASVGFHQPD